jgi:hypothetical protein
MPCPYQETTGRNAGDEKARLCGGALGEDDAEEDHGRAEH